MRCAVVLLSACVALASASSAISATQQQFDEFMIKFGKRYPSQEEYDLRFTVFRENLEVAASYNALGGAVHGVTKFMDLTPGEFAQYYTNYRPAARPEPENVVQSNVSLPASIDWREKGVVTPVKDQGQCGSCWAFSAVEEVETDWILAGNSMVELSPQQVVSCDKVDAGCDGGDTPTAYDYIIKAGGLETEAEYPYTSGNGANGKCKFNLAGATVGVESYAEGTKKRDETLFQSNLVALGPMSVCLATGGWQTYVSGVLTKRECGTDVDHCTQAVGYSTGTGKDYWIIRNSWNTDWGIDGYIYIELGNNACDVAGEVTYVKTTKPKL